MGCYGSQITWYISNPSFVFVSFREIFILAQIKASSPSLSSLLIPLILSRLKSQLFQHLGGEMRSSPNILNTLTLLFNIKFEN